MARNLLERGFRLVVHSRSRGPVDELAAAGAAAAQFAGGASRVRRRVMVTMVPDSPEVIAVLQGTRACSARTAGQRSST